MVHDNRFKFRDPRLNRSREMPSKAVVGVIFGRFRTSITSDWEKLCDVISVRFVEPTGVDVGVKFGDY